MILQKISSLLPELRPREKKLASFILENADDVVHFSISELAEKAGTSSATISRFCKHLELSGYPGLKLKLAEAPHRPDPVRNYQDLVAGQSLDTVIANLTANHMRSIEDTAKLIEPQRLQQVIDSLGAARKIDLYGLATSGLVARDMQQKLMRLGKIAEAPSDPHLMINSAANLQPGDVAVAISYNGQTAETLAALSCAKNNGATTIALTRYGISPLSKLADLTLYTSSMEQGMRRGDMASRIAQLHMVDILFVGLVSTHFEKYAPLLENTYQAYLTYRKTIAGLTEDHH